MATWAGVVGASLLLLDGFACGQVAVEAPPEPTAFRLLIEPRFQGAPVWEALPGGKELGWAAGVEASLGTVRPLTAGELEVLRLDFPAFRAKARAAANRLLAASEPKLIKNEAGQVKHVLYHGKNPLTATVLFAEGLHARHQGDLGDAFLAVAPDRHSLFLFRADPDLLERETAMLAGIHESSVYPVSLEVVYVSAGGLRVIGTLGQTE